MYRVCRMHPSALLRYGRDLLAKGAFPKLASGDTLGSDTVKTVAFAVQMLLAYFLMVRDILLIQA